MQLYFYKTESGKEPLKDALLKLPKLERAAAFERLSGIAQHGFEYSRVTFRPISGKLWEIKYKCRNQHRILYCTTKKDELVLLHYVKKKTQKLELNDKKIAELRMKEVLS